LLRYSKRLTAKKFNPIIFTIPEMINLLYFPIFYSSFRIREKLNHDEKSVGSKDRAGGNQYSDKPTGEIAGDQIFPSSN